MYKRGIIAGAFFMATAVILGAFGAHGLKKIISLAEVEVFKTGVFYQFIHSIGIFVALLTAKLFDIPKLNKSLWFFGFGILFFSGSLYLLSTQSALGVSLKFLGPITPLGGLLFILGWIYMLIEVVRQKNF